MAKIHFDINSAISPSSVDEWRNWLSENHLTQTVVWVIFYKKKATNTYISWSDAVDQAICFGWIDSTRKSLDDERFVQQYTKRKPKSSWSKINKEKVDRLSSADLIAPAGLLCIETAKKDGSWFAADEVEKLVIPPDLLSALEQRENALEVFHLWSKSIRKSALTFINAAKREDTRKKRIEKVSACAQSNQKPNYF